MSQDHTYKDYKDTYVSDSIDMRRDSHEVDVVTTHEVVEREVVVDSHDIAPPVHHNDEVGKFMMLGYHVDCNVSRNIFTTLFFAFLFMMTFSLFAITYFIIWSNLFVMGGNAAEWVYIIFTWLGFSLGGCLAYTFFKMVESLKIRGLFICGLLVPLYIYAQYLNWTYNKGTWSDSVQVFFIYAGAVINGLFGGAAMGLLFSFQGCFTSVYAAPKALGSQFAVHWFIFPWYYIVLVLLASWTMSNKNAVILQLANTGLAWEKGAWVDFALRCAADFDTTVIGTSATNAASLAAQGGSSKCFNVWLAMLTKTDLGGYLARLKWDSQAPGFTGAGATATPVVTSFQYIVDKWLSPQLGWGDRSRTDAEIVAAMQAAKPSDGYSILTALAAGGSSSTSKIPGAKFESLILIFICATAFIWSWLKDPEERDIQAVLNPAAAAKAHRDGDSEAMSFERHDTVFTEIPDTISQVFTFDNVRQSVSKTYERVYQEEHLVALFFVAGYVFMMFIYWTSVYAILQSSWTSVGVFTYACIFVGAWFWGWWYGSNKSPFCGFHPKMTVVYLNLWSIFIGYIFYLIYNWLDRTLWEPAGFTWFGYLIAIFGWSAVMGLQNLAQLCVADLMPRGHGNQVDIKLARCFGSYVLIFGLGALTNALIFQICVKQGDPQTKEWTHRVETFFVMAFLIHAIMSFHKHAHKSFENGPQDPSLHQVQIETEHHAPVQTHHGML